MAMVITSGRDRLVNLCNLYGFWVDKQERTNGWHLHLMEDGVGDPLNIHIPWMPEDDMLRCLEVRLRMRGASPSTL